MAAIGRSYPSKTRWAGPKVPASIGAGRPVCTLGNPVFGSEPTGGVAPCLNDCLQVRTQPNVRHQGLMISCVR